MMMTRATLSAEVVAPHLGPPRRFHAILDVEVPAHAAATADQVRAILEELPPLIDMRVLAGPYVVEGMPYNPGITGFAIIDFSHISIHTFSNHRFVMVDIFSCKPYDLAVVRGFLSGVLHVRPDALDLRVVSWE